MQLLINNNLIDDIQIKEIEQLLFEKSPNFILKINATESNKNCSIFKDGILNIQYVNKSYIFRSIFNYACNLNINKEIEEKIFFDNVGIMLDCSRNGVPTIEFIKKFIRYMSLMGYTSLQLYTEDTYEVENEPYFGYMRGRYSQKELKELNDYGLKYGITMIPCIQTLAHLNSIFRWPEYQKINDVNDILLVEEERTYELIENMFKTIRKCFTTNIVNIGMDEAFLLGMGKYHEKHGYTNRVELMLKHLKKVSDIAQRYNFKCVMWSDMFYRLAFGGYYSEEFGKIGKDIVENVPSNVELIYWDYYSDKQEHFEKIIMQHKQFNNELWFAGGAWTYLGFLPDNCFTIKEVKSSVKACEKQNVKNYLMTMWGDNGSECSNFLALPGLMYLAECSYNNYDDELIKHKFERLTGLSLDIFMVPEKIDKVGNITNANFTDPSKYLLYNDCFTGVLDTTIPIINSNEYQTIANKLKKYCKDKKWGYLFSYSYELAKVLEIKYNLGIKTREFYLKNNKKELLKLAKKEYKMLIKRLTKFYVAFEKAWICEKKHFGFEIQNYRLGGLISRLSYCQKRIVDYCKNKTANIEELESVLLDYFGHNEEYHKLLGYINVFDKIFSVNSY